MKLFLSPSCGASIAEKSLLAATAALGFTAATAAAQPSLARDVFQSRPIATLVQGALDETEPRMTAAEVADFMRTSFSSEIPAGQVEHLTNLMASPDARARQDAAMDDYEARMALIFEIREEIFRSAPNLSPNNYEYLVGAALKDLIGQGEWPYKE